jgi:hypothetical protein
VEQWAFSPKGWEETVWQQFRIDGQEAGAPAFIVDVSQHPSIPLDQRRWREQKSVWNQAWFSTQRCANGLLRYARQTGSKELERRARLMTRVALLAPQRDGLFPSVYAAGGGGYSLYRDTPDWDKARWINSDRRPEGTSAEAYHLLDAAFTARCCWNGMTWRGRTKPRRCPTYGRFADRLCTLQMRSGGIPRLGRAGRPHPLPTGRGPGDRDGRGAAAGPGRPLPRETRYRESALKALRYLEEGPVRESRWEDFETYFSCSRWGRPTGSASAWRGTASTSRTPSPRSGARSVPPGAPGPPRPALPGPRAVVPGRALAYQQVWSPPGCRRSATAALA